MVSVIPPAWKGKIMNALWRRTLAALAVAGAVFAITAPAAAARPVTVVPHACPAGTNWDNATHTCV